MTKYSMATCWRCKKKHKRKAGLNILFPLWSYDPGYNMKHSALPQPICDGCIESYKNWLRGEK